MRRMCRLLWAAMICGATVKASQLEAAAEAEALKGPAENLGIDTFQQVGMFYLPGDFVNNYAGFCDPFRKKVFIAGARHDGKQGQTGVIHRFDMATFEYLGMKSMVLPLGGAVSDLKEGVGYFSAAGQLAPKTIYKVSLNETMHDISAIELPALAGNMHAMMIVGRWLYASTDTYETAIIRVHLDEFDTDSRKSREYMEEKYNAQKCKEPPDINYRCNVLFFGLQVNFFHSSVVDRPSMRAMFVSLSHPTVVVQVNLRNWTIVKHINYTTTEDDLPRYGADDQHTNLEFGTGAESFMSFTSAATISESTRFVFLASRGALEKVSYVPKFELHSKIKLLGGEMGKCQSAVTTDDTGYSFFGFGGDESGPSSQGSVIKVRTGPCIGEGSTFNRTDKLTIQLPPEMRTQGRKVAKMYMAAIDSDRGNRDDEPIEKLSIHVYFAGEDNMGESFITKLRVLGPPKVYKMWPMTGPVTGGTYISFQGEFFDFCQQGIIRFAPTWLGTNGPIQNAIPQNDTFMYAVSPPRTEEMPWKSFVKVSMYLNLWSATFTTFTYYDAKLRTVTPRSGPICGGTTHILHGSGFINTFGETRLRFTVGTSTKVFVADVQFLTDTEIQFTAPRYVQGSDNVDKGHKAKVDGVPISTVVISLALNGDQYIRMDKPLFLYYDVRLNNIHPRSGPILGDTKLAIQGMGFIDTKEIRVNITWTGDKEDYPGVKAGPNGTRADMRRFTVPGHFMSGTLITVVMPPVPSRGYASIAVAVNGQDFIEYAPRTEMRRFRYYGNTVALGPTPEGKDEGLVEGLQGKMGMSTQFIQAGRALQAPTDPVDRWGDVID